MIGPILSDNAALLLDLDGTLLDIAPTPDAVIVPPDLVASLRRARIRFGDALAIITGRPIAQVEMLLGDAPYAIAGEHGGAIRPRPGAPVERVALPAMPRDWIARAENVVLETPGALIEHKARGFVFHYRQVPEAGPALRRAAEAIVADQAESFGVMAAHMAWEIRPRGADKGTAVQALMTTPPFFGRIPIYVGDDVTDEDAIVRAQALGGTGLRVAEAFIDPTGVRAWLSGLA